MSGLLCSGNVRIALLKDDGTNVGFLPLKNTVELSLNPGAVNTIDRTSKMVDTLGQNLDTINIPGSPVLAISVDDVDADTVGMQFRGAVADLTLPIITGQDVTLAVVPGFSFPLALAGYKVTVSALKSTDATPVTYATPADYTVDSDSGMITIVKGGAIAAPQDVVATISAAAVTGRRVTAASKNQLLISVAGRMKNLATGKFVNVNVPQAVVAPSEAVDFLSGAWVVNKMSGPIKTLPGQAPYTVDFLD
ncbi:MAG: hypothetical protein ABIU96_03930 [Rhodanobacter sp.]